MTSAELALAGRALYGRGWQTRLAEALGVNASTVRRWVSGRVAIRPATAIAIASLVDRKLGRAMEPKR